jgi:hypothetical protein
MGYEASATRSGTPWPHALNREAYNALNLTLGRDLFHATPR